MLHYLGTCKDYHSLQWLFHVLHNTISGIVLDVCQAIIDEYASELIKTLTTPEEWMVIANRFVLLHLLWFYYVSLKMSGALCQILGPFNFFVSCDTFSTTHTYISCIYYVHTMYLIHMYNSTFYLSV